MSRILLSSVAAIAVLASAQGAAAQTEIQFWHAMGGNLGDTVNELAAGFNAAQKEYKVTAVYKGSYTETLTAAIAAFRAKQAPHIVQVFEVGTANMMAAKGAIYPIYQVMEDAKEPFDPKAYIGPVYGYCRRPASTPTSRRQPGTSWARWPARPLPRAPSAGSRRNGRPGR